MAFVPFPPKTRPFHQLPTPLRALSRFSTVGLTPVAVAANDDDDEALISSVVSILQSHRLRTRWNYLKKTLPPHHTFTPNQLSSIALRLRNTPRLALRFFNWMVANPSLCSHDLHSRATFIHILARARLRSAALSIVQSSMVSGDNDSENLLPDILGVLARSYRECDSAPFVFDLVVRACLAAKRIDRAVTVVRVLKSRGIFPENRTCCELIKLASKMRGSEEGFGVYREVFGDNNDSGLGKESCRVWKPNVHIFNALFIGLYRDRKLIEKKSKVLAEMEKFGCERNCFTYCILMAGYCDKGMVKGAMEIWEEMRSRGIKPDVAAYNTIIGGVCDIGDVSRAEELFQEMVLGGSGGIEPSCITYEHLMKGYCRSGDVKGAVLVYADLRRKGFQPGTVAVEMLLEELCGRGHATQALRIFRDAMGREGFRPSVQCYRYLIKGFCGDGEMEQALGLQAEMVGKGFQADAVVYDAFIAGYMKVNEVEKAGRLREEMSQFCLY